MYNMLDDCQPQPRTLKPTGVRRGNLAKLFEYSTDVFPGYPRPRVDHRDMYPFIRPPDHHPYRAAGRREFQGVADEVPQHLL